MNNRTTANQAITILSSWRPGRIGPPPKDIIARYARLIRFLEGLPSDALPEIGIPQCVRCLSVVGGDKFCSVCKRFLWGQGMIKTFPGEDLPFIKGMPSVEGLLNPASAYPVPPEHTLSPTHLAIWLATRDEMERMDLCIRKSYKVPRIRVEAYPAPLCDIASIRLEGGSWGAYSERGEFIMWLPEATAWALV